MTGRRKKNAPAFVFGIDGEIYMNAFELDGVDSLADVARLLRDEAPIFVGVLLLPPERCRLASHLADAGSEAAGFIAGRRRWKKRPTRSSSDDPDDVSSRSARRRARRQAL